VPVAKTSRGTGGNQIMKNRPNSNIQFVRREGEEFSQAEMKSVAFMIAKLIYDEWKKSMRETSMNAIKSDLETRLEAA
jgi:hypothetical protein